MVRASDVNPEPIRWLIKGRIPAGALTVIAGRPGYGKSLLTAYIAAQVSQECTVIFSSREDARAEVIRPRLEAAGADLRRIVFPGPLGSGGFDEDMLLPADLDLLEASIVEVKAKLVVFDPIASHFRRAGAVDDRTMLNPLAKILSRTGAALIAVHHMPKSVAKNSDALQAVGGASSGLAAAARIVYVFGPGPEDSEIRVFAAAKSNWGQLPASMVFEVDSHDYAVGKGKSRKVVETATLELLNNESDIDASAVVAASTSNKGKEKGGTGKLGAALEWVTNYLALGPRPAAEVMEDAIQFGLSKGTLRRAKKELVVQTDRVGYGSDGFFTWRLPDDHPALLEQIPGEGGGDDE